MKTIATTLTATTLIVLGIASAHAEDMMEKAAGMIEMNCSSCHGDEVYTRDNRKVTDKNKLSAQVKRCASQQAPDMTDEDIHSVVEYLNTHFYKFK